MILRSRGVVFAYGERKTKGFGLFGVYLGWELVLYELIAWGTCGSMFDD